MSNKIIVVDDSKTIRKQVGLALMRAGYKIVEACDGLEGLKAVEQHADAALVICDVNMPNMDGLEMMTALQADGRRPGPPVLFLTTEGDPTLVRRAQRAGAKGWMVKPFKPDLLVAMIEKLIGAAATAPPANR